MKYVELLNTRWVAGPLTVDIVGTWAEDGSEYKIEVPTQLRDSLIGLQNALYDHKVEIEDLKRQLAYKENGIKVLL